MGSEPNLSLKWSVTIGTLIDIETLTVTLTNMGTETVRVKRPLITLPASDRGLTRTWIPNLVATLYYAEHVHTAQTEISTPYFCIGQKSESAPVSESGNVIKPLRPTSQFVLLFLGELSEMKQ